VKRGEQSQEGHGNRRRNGVVAWLGDKGPVWISAIGTLMAAVVAAIGLMIAGSSGGEPSTASDTPPRPSADVTQRAETGALYPATIPPRHGTCDAALTIAVDGSAGPITCGRKVNVSAWRRYARINPLVMSLGTDTDPEQVGQAMCTDLSSKDTNTSTEVMAYRIAAAYYGWDFALDPADFFPDNC
jgi:hypothetical protein